MQIGSLLIIPPVYFQEIAEMGEVTLRDFIKEYNDQLKLQAKMAGTPKVSKAIHSPLIKLLTELLRLSLVSYPSNAKATFLQCTKVQRFLNT